MRFTAKRADINAAMAIWQEWTGEERCVVRARRLAYRIQCGRTPHEACVREMAYQAWLAWIGCHPGHRALRSSIPAVVRCA